MAVSESIDKAMPRWRVLALVCAGVVLSMTTWFSATAIVPDLIRVWSLTPAQASWLTNMVQIGFVAGALGASMTGLPDTVPLRALMGVSAVLAAIANLSLLWAPSIEPALAARFTTGVALAGIYPSAMKTVSTWFVCDRGIALGCVIGALTLGSASPHLIRMLTDHVDWQAVVMTASAATLGGAILLAGFSREGPFPFNRAEFDPRQIGRVLRDRRMLLTNIGYFGHMWELYAMWGWFLAFASAALPALGLADAQSASILTFAVVASGVIGSILGGLLADRIGRAVTAALMMAVSGSCALLIGLAFDGPIWLLVMVAIVWGISVIGDSAQFSAMATELADKRFVGTALALQLGLGFSFTIVSIQLLPLMASAIGWRWSFLLLAPGPAIGVAAMLILRHDLLASEKGQAADQCP